MVQDAALIAEADKYLATAAKEEEDPLKAPACLLHGEPGAGKTFALPTLIKADLELFVIITDPGGYESLIDGLNFHKQPIEKLHWHYIPPAKASWSSLKEMAKKINMMSYEDLSKIKAGVDKNKFRQFFELLDTLSNFHCDRTGESYGPVDEFDSTRALAIDGLSGINTMALNNMIGLKPTAHEGEWGVAMNSEEQLMNALTADLKCPFALVAHVERFVDQLHGGNKDMTVMLGKRLAPKMPRLFSEVILAYQTGGDHYWSTMSATTVVKTRSLKRSDKLLPDFGPIITKWRERTAQSQRKEEVT